ncbi:MULTISPECIES: ABC transporter permease subunit [Rhizobium/Agrobacterium group]|uniref:ABC transporter permease subunit n=2 Tax=Rhizobium/Agrobacterium group TaxID=227290 RepID=A0AA44FAC9_AGRTU|nr:MULTISPECIES: ABC transporter permease subunit [Rhizobium/Agrobacterium group]MBB3947447.1 putative spermidine/putrescine transport system permease protein [Rhizobium skierniewicense]NSY52191.1 ABC transporter permease subunit [Agrobacterium tumefaciens]NSZ09939.1 ABC transporter permease subunit [Agrobacterium tumefaciens]NTB84724.1 ABC transporter permease subunit [Agrobacterium tumefaciens]NTC16553.1 ABC transporter permease subunit [Agrobacterium tumefaciens]
MTRNFSRDWERLFLLAPVFILLLVAFALPLLYIVPSAFGGNAAGRFLKIFESPVYLKIIWTTVRISLEATAITLVVSFPLAWLLSRATGFKAMFLGLLVLVPFLSSVLVRTFAWLAILGQRGLINGTLLSLGLISEPLPLLFSEPAVILALVHSSIPMMAFALVTVLRRIDGRVLLAANTLGANPLRAWFGIVIPLSIRGIQSGVIIIFLFTIASFIAPAFLGNQRQQMLAQVIQSEIETGADWPFAAALGITLALIATIVVALLSWGLSFFSRWQRPGSSPANRSQPSAGHADMDLLRRPVALPSARFQFSTLLSNGARLFEPVYLTLISIFILLPLVVLFPVSFSSADVLIFPPPGYSLRWFETIFSSSEWTSAAVTSLRIGVATCLLSLVLATFAVLGFGRQKFILQGVLEALVQAPLSVPAVVFALGAYLAFARVGLVDTEIGIIIAHTVLIFPVVYLIASATYSSIDPRLSLAAASLGANPWSVFRTIVFPLLLPGLAIGALIAVLLSFDESVASIFLSDLSVKTLPRKLWEGIRFNTSPESAAVSAVLLGVTCAFIVVGIVVMLWRKRVAGAPTMIGVLDTSAEET